MDAPPPLRGAPKRRAFTLIEITISLGIVAFTCVTLVGMLPVGLNALHHAMNSLVEVNIAQGLASDLQLSAFANVQTISTGPFSVPSYYDSEGLKLPGTTGAIYTAKVLTSKDLSSNSLFNSAVPLESGAGNVVLITITAATTPTEVSYFPLVLANNHQ